MPKNTNDNFKIYQIISNFDKKYKDMRGRPKGSRDKDKPFTGTKQYHLRVDTDVEAYLYSRPSIIRYLNELIRQDMKRAIESGEYVVPVEKEDICGLC